MKGRIRYSVVLLFVVIAVGIFAAPTKESETPQAKKSVRPAKAKIVTALERAGGPTPEAMVEQFKASAASGPTTVGMLTPASSDANLSVVLPTFFTMTVTVPFSPSQSETERGILSPPSSALIITN